MVKQSTYRNLTIGVVIVLIILGIAVVIWSGGFGPSGATEARATATTFGQQMQKVSLLAPDASSTIASVYGTLVTPELLTAWEKNPKHAPGRLTSSPYPDHLEITSVTKQGSGYIVLGEVVEETSTGEAGRVPVILQIIPQGSEWLIAAYQESATSTSTN